MIKNNTLVTLGPQGTYSHQAAEQIIVPDGGISLELRTVPKKLVEEVRTVSGDMIAGALGNMAVIKAIPDVRAALVAVHNSYGQTVKLTPEALYELYLRDPRLHIHGWISLPVIHTLAALEGMTTDEVTSVHAHPQAIEQCRPAGLGRLGGVNVTEETSNTARVPELEWGEAVICSVEAANKLGLDVLDEDFGIPNLETDFALTTVHEDLQGFQNLTQDRTMLILTAGNECGSLGRCATVLGDEGINMSSIHSQAAGGESHFPIVTSTEVDLERISAKIKEVGGTIKKL